MKRDGKGSFTYGFLPLLEDTNENEYVWDVAMVGDVHILEINSQGTFEQGREWFVDPQRRS
jgi:hypothetical protein